MRFSRFQMPVFCAAVLSLALVVGCAAEAPPKTVLLCGFENLPDPTANSRDPLTHFQHPNNIGDDFQWTTGNYATLESFNKLATQGRYCAKVRFTIPSDLKVITPDKKPKTWESGMTLSTDSGTKLAVTDWSTYKYLSLDIYNQEDKEYKAYLRVGDIHSKITATAKLVAPKGKTVIGMSLTQVADAWLDPHDMKFLTLYLDTADLTVDPVLYIDNVKLQ